MQSGMVTDSSGYLSFDKLLKTASQSGNHLLTFACGYWSQAPHLYLNQLIEAKTNHRVSERAWNDFLIIEYHDIG
jgi:hypothetical protein